jgi:hypothetical protein
MKKRQLVALGMSLSLMTSPILPILNQQVFAETNEANNAQTNEQTPTNNGPVKEQTPVNNGQTSEQTNENQSTITVDLVNTSYKKEEFKILLKLPQDVDKSTLNTNTIHIRNLNIGDDQTADSAIKLNIDMINKVVTVTLKEDLDQNVQYTLIVDGVKSKSGVAYEEIRESFQSTEQEEEVVTELAPVLELKGEAISPTAIKWTWKYDKAEEKKIDGFRIYDEDGDLLTEDNDLNAKDRQFVQKGLKPGKKYTISIKAFKIVDGEETLESEEISASASTKALVMPSISEKAIVVKVSGYNIQYFWEYKNYQDFKENFTDYEIQIADDKNFTKNVVKAPLIKGNVLHKNALPKRSTKNGMKITKYFRIVNKAYNIATNPTQKIIYIDPAVSPKAPTVTIGETGDGYAVVQIKDQSTNEASFNLYYYDKYGQKYLFTTVKSKSTKTTGDVYAVRVYWLEKGEFHGFKVTAVDKNGIEGKESEMAIFSEAENEEEE